MGLVLMTRGRAQKDAFALHGMDGTTQDDFAAAAASTSLTQVASWHGWHVGDGHVRGSV